MTTSASFSKAMSAIVGHIAPVLRSKGFRRRRHSFNRHLQDDIVHVISFCQAPATDPRHGTFHIEAGIYFQFVEIYNGPRRSLNWVNNFDCSIRSIPGTDQNKSSHQGSKIEMTMPILLETEDEITRKLVFLDKMQTATDLLNRSPTEPRDFIGVPIAIQQACYFVSQGDHNRAKFVISQYVAQLGSTPTNLGHAKIIQDRFGMT